jgi:hypothetical protein
MVTNSMNPSLAISTKLSDTYAGDSDVDDAMRLDAASQPSAPVVEDLRGTATRGSSHPYFFVV